MDKDAPKKKHVTDTQFPRVTGKAGLQNRLTIMGIASII